MERRTTTFVKVVMRPNLRKYSTRGAGPCAALGAAYARCLVGQGTELPQGACEKEFGTYAACLRSKQ